MPTAQRYGSQGQSRPDSPQTGQNSPQSVNSDPLAASEPFFPGFDIEVSLICTGCNQPTEAYLYIEALHLLQATKLGELQDEYRFCRENPDHRPDLDFVQRQLNVICELGSMAKFLTYQLESGYRHLSVSTQSDKAK